MLNRLHTLLQRLLLRPAWGVSSAPVSPYGQPYASFNRRMMASMIDAAILTLLLLPFNDAIVAYVHDSLNLQATLEMAMLGAIPPEQVQEVTAKLTAALLLLGQIQYAVMAVYSLICWYFWSATPGKLLLGIRIADFETGANITGRQSLVRVAGYIVSGVPLMLGFFAISWSRTRRGWHDRMAGTAVVTIAKSTP